jgi:hypothetical protein
MCDGEPPTSLQRPIVLSFDHFASLEKNDWTFIIYYQESGSTQWNRNLKPSQPAANKNKGSIKFFFQVGRQSCHVMTACFGRYLLSGKPRHRNVTPLKCVRLLIYWTPPYEEELSEPSGYDQVPFSNDGTVNIASPILSSKSEFIRVYIVPGVAMSLENVQQQERRSFRGVKLAEAHNFFLSQYGALCIQLEKTNSISLAENVDQAQYQQYLVCS